MHFLRTDKGRISSLWIVALEHSPRGDWSVTYSIGSGAFDARARHEEVVSFLKRVDPESAPKE